MLSATFFTEAILETDHALRQETLNGLQSHIEDGHDAREIIESLLTVTSDRRGENVTRCTRASYALCCIFLHFEQARLSPKDPLPLKAQRLLDATVGRFEIDPILLDIALNDQRSSVRGRALIYLASTSPFILRNSIEFLSVLPALLDGHDQVLGTATAKALNILIKALPADTTLTSIRQNRSCTSGAWSIRDMLAETETDETDKEN